MHLTTDNPDKFTVLCFVYTIDRLWFARLTELERNLKYLFYFVVGIDLDLVKAWRFPIILIDVYWVWVYQLLFVIVKDLVIQLEKITMWWTSQQGIIMTQILL